MSFPTAQETRAGVDVYNRFLAEVWRSKQGEITRRLTEAAEELVRTEKRIKEIDRLELDLTQPPRLDLTGAVDGPGRLRAVFAAPGAGGWNLGLRARVGWLLRPAGSLVEVRIERLRVTAALELDRTSPVEVSLADSGLEVDLGDIELDSSNFLLKVLSGIGNLLFELLENVIEELARDALAEGLPNADGVRAIAELGLADRPVEFAGPAPELAPLEDAAKAVAAHTRGRQMPFATVLNALVRRDDPDGEPVGYKQFEDSAIWTGHYLAGEALRHRQTGDPEALANVRRALDGLDALIHLADPPGLLSRVRVPLTETAIVEALDDERRRADHEDRLFTSLDGKYRSIGHVTRDQYAGAVLGTGVAATQLRGPEAERARGIALEMIDYLVSRHFCPTEVAPDPGTDARSTSVTYLMHPSQVLAILRLGAILDPDRYGPRFRDFAPIWSVQWLFQWLQSLDPQSSYYKFNLEHSMTFLLQLLEEDPERRARFALGLRTLRRPLRFHANAWFNLVELAAVDDDAELSRPRAEIESETRHLLAEAFGRSPLIQPVNLADHPELEVVEYRKRPGSDPEPVSRQPVPVPERPGTDFLWQRSPFALEVVWDVPEEPAMRPPGIDLTLPYWLARRLGL